jgi:hypothetical protein
MADEDSGEVEAADAAGGPEAVISDDDADLLVAEAVRRRDEQQSGRSMGRQLLVVTGCAGLGVLLITCSRILERGGHVGWAAADTVLVAGVLIIAVAGLLVLRALDLSPVTQWGEPLGEACPSCGERSLREDRVALPEAYGIVALCAPECGHAEVRVDPGGPPEPGRGRKPWSRLAPGT